MKVTNIGSLLTRRKIAIVIEDDAAYKRVTIRTKNQGIILRDVEDGSQIGTKNQFLINAGQFLLSKIDARYGAFGIVPEELDNAIITGNFWAFDVDTNQLNIEWFNLYTSAPHFIEICNQSSSGTTNRRYLDEKKFLSHEISLPDILEQNKMIEKYKITKKKLIALELEINEQSLLLSNLRQSILQEAVQGKLVSQDPNDEPASVLLEKIKATKEQLIKDKKIKKEKPFPSISNDEIPYELPEGWEWVRVGQIMDVGTGSTPLKSRPDYYKDGTIPWITSSLTDRDIISYSNDFITDIALKECNLRLYPPNTLVIAMYGQGRTRGQISELGIQATTNQACACLVPIEQDITLTKFIKMVFKKLYIEIRELAVGGAQPNLNLEKIKYTILAIPPQNEQKRIIQKVEQLMFLCDELEKTVDQSKQESELLVRAFLQEAFSESERADNIVKFTISDIENSEEDWEIAARSEGDINSETKAKIKNRVAELLGNSQQ